LADFWQTTLRPYTFFVQREGDFSSRFGCVYDARNDCALYVVTSDGVDTVGVWGSNPHRLGQGRKFPTNLARYGCNQVE
jgi:hypothetical protein